MYQLVKQISKNDLFDSLVVKDKTSGKFYFLKLLNQNLDSQFGLEALARTASLQKSLHWKKVITAKRKTNYEGREGLEYPYYDNKTWTALSGETLWANYREILPQIFQLIDYLHLHEFVHGDIKLENFLINTSGIKPRVHLGDLDFLTTAGSKPEHRLIGSYGLIAPEIVSNEGIYVETDIYALGKSLQLSFDDYLQTDSANPPISKEERAHLQELISSLSSEDRYRRPRVLLDLTIFSADKKSTSAHRHGEKPFEHERRQLLETFLHSCLKNASPNLLTVKNSANHFVRVKCRLFGIPSDLIDLLKEKAKRNRSSAWSSLLRIIQHSTIEQLGDYWHIGIPRAELLKTLTDSKYVTPFDSITNANAIHSTALLEADKHERNEHYWCGMFVCSSALAQLDSSAPVVSVENRAQLLTRVADYAQRLYMHGDAEHALKMLVSMDTLPLHERISHLIDLALVQIRAGNRWQEAKSTLQQGLQLVPANQNAEALRLKQLLGWIEMALGNREEAEQLAKETLDKARQQNLGDVIIKTLYVLGSISWREGKYPQAISYYEESVREALERNLLSDAITSIATLALASCEVGNYSKALTYCKQFLRSMDPKKHHSLLLSVYHTLVFAYIRLGKLRKGSFWLQRYLELGNTDALNSHLCSHAQIQTFFKLNSGDIVSVYRWAAQGLALGTGPAMHRIVGKIYHNLAEAELMSGQLTNCLAHIQKGIDLLTEIKDETSVAELELIKFAAKSLYEQQQEEGDLLALIATLHRHRSAYYASLGYFYLLALFPAQRKQEIVALAKAILPVDEDTVPLFSALGKLCDCYSSPSLSPDTEIFAWKQAFLILNQGHQRFLATLSCNVLIDLLNRENRYRQAYRYATFAKSISGGLGNYILAKMAVAKTPSLAPVNGQTEELVASFHAVSELLNNITDYTSTLNALLRFAVNLSGAERGVLLAPGSTASGLRVIAAIGCDDQSQADATDISRTLIDEKLKEDTPTPLVVENAMEDMRTNKYNSIMRFNIHSVIVIPLVAQNKSIGVLYLDHHVIPGVFQEDDVKYVKAIANFIAPTLATIQDIRVFKVESDQFREKRGTLAVERKFISNDQTIAKLYEHLPRAAASDITIVLRGESGTGKELLAEDIHRKSRRHNRQLIRLNCAAIPPTLIEATLFGVVKGAATSVNAQEGRLSAADGGTLFLDEIGDMALDVQAKLLRAIEYQEFQPVGGNRTIFTDIRFICATNKDLEDMIAKKLFSPDLYFRISAISLTIPPLRERPGDTLLLLDHFLEIFGEGSPPRFTLEVKNLLNAYTWPGNVRELKNFVESMCILHPGEIVDIRMLPQRMVEIASSRYNQLTTEATEKAMLADLLKKSGGNQSEAARILKVPLSTLRRKLRKYGLL